MSLGSDYLEIIDLMFEIEEIDIWHPLNHMNLAYTMDKLNGTSEYSEAVNSWKKLAKEKDFNELCWNVREYTYRFVFEDERFSEKEKEVWKHLYEQSKVAYNKKRLTRIIVLGVGRDKYAPEWFSDFFTSYMTLRLVERDNAIKDYCQKECGLTKKETEEVFEKISRWYDIHNEFYFYIKNRRFKKWSPVTVEAIPAEEIFSTTNLNPLESYLFLFHLRTHQIAGTEEVALKELKELQSKCN